MKTSWGKKQRQEDIRISYKIVTDNIIEINIILKLRLEPCNLL